MRGKTFDAAAYVDAAAAASGIALDEAMRAGVIANLERTYAFARLLTEEAGLAETEPAPVFRPRAPSSS
ncbi:MAG: DUF4089 domain-containing protein [Alphaproteobacteria bacterium]|nr:DUF4089 domain-containing protein [Alphaproteobacteria bacterium]